MLSIIAYCSGQADAGPDKAICSGKGVEIGAMSNSPDLCYSWSAVPDDPSIVNLTTPKIIVNPAKTTTYTLTVVGKDFSSKSTSSVKVYVVTDVAFSESTDEKYGYDDHTNPAILYKSVKNGDSDPIKIKITPADGFKGVYFKVNSPLFQDVKISPVQAPSDEFNLTITGTGKGEEEVDVNCEKEDGTKIKEVDVFSYDLITKRVGIRVVNYGNVISKPYSISEIRDYLNKVYGQAVCAWEVDTLPPITANIDLNNDGLIDISNNSREAAEIIKNCKDDSYDYNIFLVDNIFSSVTPVGFLLGKMPIGEKYGFVSVKSHQGKTASVENTMAHEIGHGAFSLRHPRTLCDGTKGDSDSSYDTDRDNIMDYCDKSKLRIFQWNLIQN